MRSSQINCELRSNQDKICRLQKQFFTQMRLKKPKEEIKELRNLIDHLFEKSLQISTEKIQIADKTYQLVDNSVLVLSAILTNKKGIG